MKEWLSDLLLSRDAATRAYFDGDAVELLLRENAKAGSYSREVFSLAVLELWHQEFLTGRPRKASTTAHDERKRSRGLEQAVVA